MTPTQITAARANVDAILSAQSDYTRGELMALWAKIDFALSKGLSAAALAIIQSAAGWLMAINLLDPLYTAINSALA